MECLWIGVWEGRLGGVGDRSIGSYQRETNAILTYDLSKAMSASSRAENSHNKCIIILSRVQ